MEMALNMFLFFHSKYKPIKSDYWSVSMQMVFFRFRIFKFVNKI